MLDVFIVSNYLNHMVRKQLAEAFQSSTIRNFSKKHGELAYANCAGDITDDMIAYQWEFGKNETPNIDKSQGLTATFRANDGTFLVLKLNDKAKDAGMSMEPTWGGGNYLFKNHDDWSREITGRHGYTGNKNYEYHHAPRWAYYGYDSKKFKDDMNRINYRKDAHQNEQTKRQLDIVNECIDIVLGDIM